MRKMPKIRPMRLSLTNEQGKKITLASGKLAFTRLDGPRFSPQEHIVLGLGPLNHAHDLDDCLPHSDLKNAYCKVYYLECPDFSQALADMNAPQNIPSHWVKVSVEELLKLLDNRAIWWYKQNTHLFPDFWSPILGQVQAKLLYAGQSHTRSNSVYVAGNKQLLLHQEICLAFTKLGYAVHEGKDLQSVLIAEQPSLFFSVNLRGLDNEGVDFALLQALNIPVAIWFVDNPWHILSALRLPWWKQARLFVTDDSFIPELKKQGAKHVYHLPLAAAQHMWQPERSIGNMNTRQAVQAAQNASCIFVGRAQFPEHAKFFAAAKVDPAILNEALAKLRKGEQVHFHWWQERLQLGTWPGHEVRQIGYGAEQCACAKRVLWLRKLLPIKPIIFGDSVAWQSFLTEANPDIFYASLDYYTELAVIYHVAPCVLNVTSLLLPAGLTQRHFDVWAAGGFLLSDNTAGLDIFPERLTKYIRISHHQELTKTIRNLDEKTKNELTLAWQELIKTEHSYEQRMNFVLQCAIN